MKKISWIIIILILVVVLLIGYIYYSKIMDAKLAIGFAEALRNHDISDVDRYLSNDTLITCNGKSNTYEDLRANVIAACNEKRYLFSQGSSYGHKTAINSQNINITLYGKLDGEDIGECHVFMKLKRIGLLQFKIDALVCDDQIFEYLFYANVD